MKISARNKAAKSEEKVSISKSIISSKMKKLMKIGVIMASAASAAQHRKKAETHGGVMKMAWRHEAKAKTASKKKERSGVSA
jgi:predicted transcriptional regulator